MLQTRTLLFVTLILAMLTGLWLPRVAAQSPVEELSALAVELWPDYDRPAMLVLLTGSLPADTPLPATVTIPLPAEADIHAVAFFDETGVLKQLPAGEGYTVEDGRLILNSPSARFRVEYYTPYADDQGERTYRFDWTSDLPIDQLSTVVQQPLAADSIDINPAPSGAAAERGDGLQYYTLPSRTVGSGEPYTVDLSYTVTSPVLSAPQQALPAATAVAPAATSAVGGGTESRVSLWWLLGLGILLLAGLGAGWYLGRRQSVSGSRARKPRPVRSASAPASRPDAGATRFCHNCGRQAQPNDSFCRNCGTQLKKDN